jgi:uncharacterized membrane protein YkoI
VRARLARAFSSEAAERDLACLCVPDRPRTISGSSQVAGVASSIALLTRHEDEDTMRDKLKGAIIATAVIAALAGGGAAIAGAAGGKDDGSGQPITGSALDRAKGVALNHMGGGRVTGTEVNDEEGAYEVEVTRADGTQVDVHLDSAFKVIGDKADGDKGGDSDSASEN